MKHDYLDMALADNWPGWPTKRPSEIARLRFIRDKVADAFGISVAQLVGPRRIRSFVRARQIAAYLMRSEYDQSLPLIGLALNRDPKTIFYALRVVASSPDLLTLAAAISKGHIHRPSAWKNSGDSFPVCISAPGAA